MNGVYSSNILLNIKDGGYIIYLDEYKLIRTHWIALSVNSDNVIYFVSFRVEHNPKEIKKLIGNKNFTTNFDRIQTND